MHPSILEAFQGDLLTADEVAGKRVIEVGACDVNGSVRPIIEAHGPASYLGVDYAPGPRVDQVVDCTALVDTFGEASFDVVVTTEMLEHVRDWKACVANLVGIVAENGLLVVTTRSPGFPFHGYPEDHWRYTPQTMRAILEAFDLDVLDCYPDPDPLSPGVIAKARKPAGWDIPAPDVLDRPLVQPVPIGPRPLTILGYPHEADGSGYYRYYLPYKHLARGVTHRILLPQPGQRFTPDADQVEEIDVIVGQRICGPNGVDLWESWKGKTTLVYETDDDILHPDQSSGLPHMFDPAVQASFVHCLRMSDLVTVSTEPLAEQMRKQNKNVAWMPNHVDADLLHMERPRRDRVTVGWAGGMSHLNDWVTAAEPVRRTLDAHPDVDMHFVGWDYSPLLHRVGRYTPWKADVWEYYKGLDFDIGLAPLADTPWNTCKSHIKALEYAALGIPVIASDVPAYNRFVVDGVTGFLVGSDDEWRTRLTDLINDESMRAEMGAKAREVAEGLTIQRGWKLWRDAYESLS